MISYQDWDVQYMPSTQPMFIIHPKVLFNIPSTPLVSLPGFRKVSCGRSLSLIALTRLSNGSATETRSPVLALVSFVANDGNTYLIGSFNDPLADFTDPGLGGEVIQRVNEEKGVGIVPEAISNRSMKKN